MSASTDPPPGALSGAAGEADAEGKLARLGAQVEAMQATLVRLLQDVVRAESRLENSRAAQLAAVNEQLVVAALTSRSEAEAAVTALEEATRATRLDALTGLPNRHLLLDRFAQAVAHAKRQHSRCALLFVDLDHFKALNDRHGHPFGDRVLKLVAERLLGAVREIDTVSRHGGDEFLVLLSDLGHSDDARAVAAKLAAAIRAPAVIDGQPVELDASIGVAVYPDDGDDFEPLVRRADAAMYAVKRVHAGDEADAHDADLDPDPDRGFAAEPGDPGAAERQLRLAQLREANEQLVLVALGAQELQAAAERARERQAAFLAAVADELSNPLAPIRIATAMLGRPPAEEPLLPRLQHIVTQQLAEISRLVDAVHLGIGALQLARQRVDLGVLIDETVDVHRRLIAAHGQHLTVQRPAGLLAVIGDAPRLALVVANLLDNASRHTQDGGRIDLTVERDAAQIRLTVSDNGIGLTAALLPLVFEPFVQDPRTVVSNDPGLGIGLTVSRALVHAHGGEITVHSDGIGRGSRFVVTLPAAPELSAADTAASCPDALPP